MRLLFFFFSFFFLIFTFFSSPPVPLPRKRRAQTTMISSGSSGIASSGTDPFSNSYPQDSFPSQTSNGGSTRGYLSSDSELPSSSVSVSSANPTMATSSTGQSSSSPNFLEKMKKTLGNYQSRVKGMAGEGHPTGEGQESVSSRRNQTYSHPTCGSNNGLNQESSQQRANQSASEDSIRYPPGNRRSILFRDDCTIEEESAEDQSLSDATTSQRIYPLGGSPGIGRHTPSGSQHSTPRESRVHSGEQHSHSGEHHSHSGEHHSHSGEHHSHSGEHHSHSGEHHSHSGEHRSLSRSSRGSHSGEQSLYSGENDSRSSTGELHSHSGEQSSSNRSGQQTPVVTPRSKMPPLGVSTGNEHLCYKCKNAVVNPSDNFCSKCGASNPFSPPGSDSKREAFKPPESGLGGIPMRASVQATKQVERKHFTQLQPLDEEVRSKGAVSPVGVHNERDVRGDRSAVMDETGISDVYSNEGLDYRLHGGAKEREKPLPARPIAWVDNDSRDDGISSHRDSVASPTAGHSSLGDNIMVKVETNLEDIKRKEKEDKEKARLEFEHKKALQEREKRMKENPDLGDLHSRGASGGQGNRDANIGKSKGNFGHAGGANLVVNNKQISMALEQKYESIKQTDEEEKKLKEQKRREYEIRKEKEHSMEEARRKAEEEVDTHASLMNLEEEGWGLLECIKVRNEIIVSRRL